MGEPIGGEGEVVGGGSVPLRAIPMSHSVRSSVFLFIVVWGGFFREATCLEILIPVIATLSP